MPKQIANAYPRKSFFLETFTRDISLEDCVLDLIDNSVDGHLRAHQITLTPDLLLADSSPHSNGPSAQIAIKYSATRFEISDDCGGISLTRAREEVFTFGHGPQDQRGTLGVYGVGLKRALFKLGNHFTMTSRHSEGDWRVALDVPAWAQKDASLSDWTIPIEPLGRASTPTGTTIVVTKLHPEIRATIEGGLLESKLMSFVSTAYGYLMMACKINIIINGNEVPSRRVLFGSSQRVVPGRDHFEQDNVVVDLVAGLAARDQQGQWRADDAGWYVLCNGRVVVNADKSDLTAWGGVSPIFHSKFIGFLGFVMFFAADPLLLPWTTTKRAVYKESLIFQAARRKMIQLARPVLNFFNSMYKTEPEESLPERRVAEQVKPTEIRGLPLGTFKANLGRVRKTTLRVQYDAEMKDLDRVRRRVRRNLSARAIGEHTFRYFLDKECPE